MNSKKWHQKSERIIKFSGSSDLERNDIRHRREFQDWFVTHRSCDQKTENKPELVW